MNCFSRQHGVRWPQKNSQMIPNDHGRMRQAPSCPWRQEIRLRRSEKREKDCARYFSMRHTRYCDRGRMQRSSFEAEARDSETLTGARHCVAFPSSRILPTFLRRSPSEDVESRAREGPFPSRRSRIAQHDGTKQNTASQPFTESPNVKSSPCECHMLSCHSP